MRNEDIGGELKKKFPRLNLLRKDQTLYEKVVPDVLNRANAACD